MLRELFEEKRGYLNEFFDQVDQNQAEKIFEAFLHTKGLIVFTGVGKSGLIAEKIAMTFSSTGTRALFLPPTNFVHGDLGVFSSEDLLVFISKSGESDELLDLVPFLKRRKVNLIAIVSNAESRLAKACDLSMYLPVVKEICPFDLVPTTSTTAQLIFGDVLAVALMKTKEFTLNAYAQNHPLGNIGKKMTLFVDDVMIKGEAVPLCQPQDLLMDVLVELSDKKCGCLLVVDSEKNLLGIFTDGDLRRSLQAQGPSVLSKPMAQLMTAATVAITKNTLAWDALKLMQKNPKKWVMVLPVLSERQVEGIIRMHDIVQAGIS